MKIISIIRVSKDMILAVMTTNSRSIKAKVAPCLSPKMDLQSSHFDDAVISCNQSKIDILF